MSILRNPSKWRVCDALRVRFDDVTMTSPLIPYDFPTMDEKEMIWDSGIARTLNNQSVTFKGWKVMWSLVADKVDLTNADIYDEWHNRNNVAYMGYWFAREGTNDWVFAGRVMPKSSDLRPWEWSGTMVFREGSENTVDVFYTSVGPDGDVTASVVSVCTGKIYADDKGVWFGDFGKTVEMFAADGVNYANSNQDPYFNFRDPCVVRNPDDGKVYCLFEGNVAGMRGEIALDDSDTGPLPPGYTVPSSAEYGQAAIGIAVLKDGAYEKGEFSRENWTMLPPLVTASFVNDQTERPHVIFRDGKVYLFTISHTSTYVGDLSGPDGVYGFVSDNGLLGHYRPLNASGLVLGNPSAAPYQTYSHCITEGPGGKFYAQSFIDTIPAPGQTDAWSPTVFRIGATLAPTIELVLEGDRTFVHGVEDYGFIPTVGEFQTPELSKVWDVRPDTALMKVKGVSRRDSQIVKLVPSSDTAATR